MQAAEIVSLVDDRALYSAVLADTASLMSMVKQSAAQQVQAGSPIGAQLGENDPIKLVSLNTDFLNAPTGDRPSSGRGGRDPGSDAGSGQFEQSIGNLRRVKVTAVFDVPLPSSTLGGFRDDIVEPILRDKLPGLQSIYAIKYDPNAYWSTDEVASSGRTSPRNPVPSGRTPTTGRGTSDSSDLKSLAPFDFQPQPTPEYNTRVTMTWYAVLDLTTAQGDD
jgi:hypothetical protein